MTFSPPNLAEMVAKYQAFLAPEDPRFGEGISGWNITSEYDADPQSESDGSPIWGCMCSPSVLASEGKRVKLQPADIEAKRAHIVVRTPTSRNELIEIERTVMHELGHVLHAKLNLPRDAEEEIMHSLDHFFSKLSPEQGQILARSFQNPMARAYRAENTAMPDPIEEKKEPDKEAPKMAEGAPRDVSAIMADLIKVAMAGQPCDELVKELVAAQAIAGSAAGGAATPVAPIEPQTMGMKPEEAYARAKRDADKASVKTLVDNLPGLDEKQKKYLHGRASIAEVNEALEAMPRQTSSQTMGALPGKIPGSKPVQSVRERAMSADDDVMARVRRASSNEDTAGLILDIPGHSIGFSPSQWLKEKLGEHERRMKAQQEAGQ
jgi:hypothetical protein